MPGAARFRAARPDVELEFNFAGSNVLTRQIVSARDADVFVSANEDEIDHLENLGLVENDTRNSLMSNRLVLIRKKRAGETGEIDVEGTIGEVWVESAGGDLRFADLDGLLDASTNGGDITVENSRAEGRVRTNGGVIRVSEVRGAIEASTLGGDVIYEGETSAPGGGALRIQTHGGDIRVANAPDGLDATTQGGDIVVERHANDRRERRIEIGRVRELRSDSTRREPLRPTHHHRYAVTALPAVSLHPAPAAGRVMLVIFTHPDRVQGLGTVVGREHDDRVV